MKLTIDKSNNKIVFKDWFSNEEIGLEAISESQKTFYTEEIEKYVLFMLY